MKRTKEHVFRNAEEVFRTYIPDYVPEYLREAVELRKREKALLHSKRTNQLINQFEKKIAQHLDSMLSQANN